MKIDISKRDELNKMLEALTDNSTPIWGGDEATKYDRTSCINYRTY